MTITCSPATEADLPAVQAVDASCVTEHQQLVLDDPGRVAFFMRYRGIIVVIVDGHVRGFALVRPIEQMHGEKRLIWIEHIAVSPTHRRQGLAMSMLNSIQEVWPDCMLHAAVHPLNQPSLSLFKNFGADMSERVLVYMPPKN